MIATGMGWDSKLIVSPSIALKTGTEESSGFRMLAIVVSKTSAKFTCVE